MSEREGRREDEARDAGDDAGGHGGYRIPGRDFAGASYGSTEREQTADHLGESLRQAGDEDQDADEEEGETPRDAS